MKTLIRTGFAVLILAGAFPAPVVADGGEPPPLCFPNPCPEKPSLGPKLPGVYTLTLR
jgi:hypothetical protein